jgi:hypothetical protein
MSGDELLKSKWPAKPRPRQRFLLWSGLTLLLGLLIIVVAMTVPVVLLVYVITR